MVAFEGNRYSVGPVLVAQKVTIHARFGELGVEIRSTSGAVVAHHRRAPSGAGQDIRTSDHARALAAILDRRLHHCAVVSIDGESYRMRGHREKLSQLQSAVSGGREIQ